MAANTAGRPTHKPVGGGGGISGVLHNVLGELGGISSLVHSSVRLITGLPGRAASTVTSSLFTDATAWVGRGSAYLLGQLGRLMSSTTQPQIGSAYFTHELGVMAAAGAAVGLPLLLLTVIQAVVQQDLGILVRAVLVRVPLAFVLTGVAVQLVSLGLAVTDSMSSAILGAAGTPKGPFVGLVRALTANVLAGSTVAAFAAFLIALGIAFGATVLWLELALRAAALEVATLFLPLALAGAIWPSTSHWARRLGEMLAALVVSKLAIVAVLALAAGNVVASGGGGFAAVVSGLALLMLAVLAPFAVFRLVPVVEAGAIGHLEGLARRPARYAKSSLVSGNNAMRRTMDSNSDAMGAGAAAEAGGLTIAGGAAGTAGSIVQMAWATGQAVADEMKRLVPAGDGGPSSAGGAAAGGEGGAGGGGGPGPGGSSGDAGGGSTWTPDSRPPSGGGSDGGTAVPEGAFGAGGVATGGGVTVADAAGTPGVYSTQAGSGATASGGTAGAEAAGWPIPADSSAPAPPPSAAEGRPLEHGFPIEARWPPGPDLPEPGKGIRR